MDLTNAENVIQAAIKIEERGEQFYLELSGLVHNLEWKGLFKYLANEEIKHKKVFQELSLKTELFEMPNSFDAEQIKQIYSEATEQLFSKEELKEKINDSSQLFSIIDYAINMEKSAIRFYNEMRENVFMNEQHIIDEVIDEENKHLKQLNEMRDTVND